METGLDEGSGEGPVVSVHDHVDCGEDTEGLALVAQNIGGNDSDPEGVEGSGGVEVVAGVRSQVVIVEGEFVGIPEEIEDTSTEPRSSVTVSCGLGLRSVLLKVVGKDLVRLVWRRLRGSTMHYRQGVEMSGTYIGSSSSLRGRYS